MLILSNDILTYWVYIIIVILISFIPGFAVASTNKTLNNIERLAISFGVSFFIIALIVPIFVFYSDFTGRFIFTVILFISTCIIIKSCFNLKFNSDLKFIIVVFLIGLISKFFLQTLWEYPVMGGDWFGHTFGVPIGFEAGNWTPPRDRTPLFSILIYSYHKLLGTSLYQYWVSQIISVVLNSAYIFPAYLIAKKAFGGWVSRVSALFMMVTPFLIFNTLYTWPKNAAMYGILMMIYFLFFCEHDIKLRYPLAGFFGGLGFWFHNYAVFYIGIAVLLLIYKEKMYKGFISKNDLCNLKRLSYLLFILLIVLVPYFTWVYSYYGTLSTSKFIYYPFAVKGYYSALLGNEQDIFNTFYSTPIKEIIMIRISNAIVTLTPVALPVNPLAASFPTYNPIYYYTHDYPGALSTLMYLAALIWFLKCVSGKRKTDNVLVSFLLFPLLITLILWGWNEWGLVSQTLHPTVPILIMLGINEVGNINKSSFKSLLIYFMFVGALVEGIIYSKLIADFYNIEGGLEAVSKTGFGFIPDFKIYEFISAYFLLDTDFDKFVNIGLLLMTLIIMVGILGWEDKPSGH